MHYLEFYSQDRDTVWPGDDKIWPIDRRETYTFSLEGLQGEKICFGAWIKGSSSNSYWGVGKNNKYNCENCCYTLGSSTIGSSRLT